MWQRDVLGRCAALLLLCGGLAACQPAPRPDAGGRGPGDGPYSDSLIAGPDIFAGQAQAAGVVTGRTPVALAGPLESDPSGDELAFVVNLLTEMQLRSYARNRETCGYIGRDGAGRMMATQINTGTEAACYLPSLPAGMRPLASIHTHGRYSPYYASEFPTVQDMMTDAEDGIDGYIATPGGRLWYIDTDTMTARQLCGRGCLPQDPRYRPEDDGPVQPVFTLRDLQFWESL